MSEITPQSVSVDREPQSDPDLSAYRVLQRGTRIDDAYVWNELGVLTSQYVPTASEVGEQFGEGDYLLVEKDSKYSFLSTYEMRVVAEKRFRLADEDA